jgi:hypothetical protein
LIHDFNDLMSFEASASTLGSSGFAGLRNRAVLFLLPKDQ